MPRYQDVNYYEHYYKCVGMCSETYSVSKLLKKRISYFLCLGLFFLFAVVSKKVSSIVVLYQYCFFYTSSIVILKFWYCGNINAGTYRSQCTATMQITSARLHTSVSSVVILQWQTTTQQVHLQQGIIISLQSSISGSIFKCCILRSHFKIQQCINNEQNESVKDQHPTLQNKIRWKHWYIGRRITAVHLPSRPYEAVEAVRTSAKQKTGKIN